MPPFIHKLCHDLKEDATSTLHSLTCQNALLLGALCLTLMLLLGLLLFSMSPEPAFSVLVGVLLLLALFSVSLLSFVIWNQRSGVTNVQQLIHAYRDLPIGLVIIDQNHTISHINDTLKRWLPLDGCKTMVDLLASCALSAQSQEALARLHTYTRQREACSEVLSLNANNQEPMLCHVDVHISQNSEHILWLIKDVTQVHPLEVQAKKTYALYHHLFHTMPYPALVTRQDGSIEWHNTSFMERFGARYTSSLDTLATILGIESTALPQTYGLCEVDSVFGSLKMIKSFLSDASDSAAYFILPDRLRIAMKEPAFDPFLTLLDSNTPHVTLDYQGHLLSWNDLFSKLYTSATEGMKIIHLLHLSQVQQQRILDFIYHDDSSIKAMMLDDPLHEHSLCFFMCKTSDAGQAKIKIFFTQKACSAFKEAPLTPAMLREHVGMQDHYAPSSHQSAPTILLVEDDPMIRTLCAKELISKGYTVIEASSGAEALHLVGTALDGVICDILLSDMNGMSLIARLEETYPKLPALLMSGHIDAAVEAFLLHHPRRQLLRKPFAMDMMFVAIEACMANARTLRAS